MPSATKVQTGYLEAVNPFTLSPGTSSLPTLTFSTSSATGIFSPSAGVIGFSTGNTQNALSILANGNVGIGTNNPSNLLTLGASGGPTMRFTDTTSGVFSILIGGSNGDLTFSADHGNIGSSTNIIFSNDGNQERLRITSSGNVGIGTTNPQAKLDVQGGSNSTIRIGRTSSYGDFGKIELNDSRSYIYSEIQPGTAFGDTFLTFGTQNNGTTTEKVRITREGNVGIGTTNPTDRGGQKLTVRLGSIATSGSTIGNNGELRFIGTPDLVNYNWAGIRAISDANLNQGILAFFTSASNTSAESSTERARITSTGNVGIGTTNPDQLLTLQAAGDAQISFKNTSGVTKAYVGTSGVFGSASTDDLRIRSDASNIIFGFSGYEKVRITSNGNVGIGTTNSQQKLHVEGNLRLGTDPYIQWVSNYIRFQTTTASVPVIEFRESASGNYEPRMDFYDGDGVTKNISIDANPSLGTYFNVGNVGIGTNNPGTKLDVRISTTAFVNGTVLNSYPISKYINSSSDGGTRGLEIGAPTGSISSPVYLKVSGTSVRFAILNQSDSEQLTILNSGNVGIGTTNPAEKLEVAGKFRLFDGGYPYIDMGVATNNYFRLIHDNPNDTFYIGKNSNSTLVINGNHSVGIGTTNPQAKLHITASSNNSSSSTYINVDQPSSTAGILISNTHPSNASVSCLTLESRNDSNIGCNTSIIVGSSSSGGGHPAFVARTVKAGANLQRYMEYWNSSYGFAHRKFNQSWQYYNGDNVSRTFTWFNIFKQIFNGSNHRLISGDDEGPIKFYLTSDNSRHMRIFEGTAVLSDLGTYIDSAPAAAINVISINELLGGFPGGCSNPFSSVSTTGFTYQRGNCFQTARVFIRGLWANNSIEKITGTHP